MPERSVRSRYIPQFGYFRKSPDDIYSAIFRCILSTLSPGSARYASGRMRSSVDGAPSVNLLTLSQYSGSEVY